MIFYIIGFVLYIIGALTSGHIKWILSRSPVAEKGRWADHLCFNIFFPLTVYLFESEEEEKNKEIGIGFLAYCKQCYMGTLESYLLSVCYPKKTYYCVSQIVTLPISLTWMVLWIIFTLIRAVIDALNNLQT